MGTITITQDGHIAGTGTLRDGVIENCSAILGPRDLGHASGAQQEAADRAYDAIEAAIARGETSLELDGCAYTWEIEGESTAQAIASLLDNDGQVWESSDGRTLEQLCEAHDADVSYRDGRGTDGPVRYGFADGSSIVTHGPAWDLGLPGGCYCWAGAGHSEDCERTLVVGERVEGGTVPEDYDTGRVVSVDGDQVEVAWDSGVTTTQPAELLRPWRR